MGRAITAALVAVLLQGCFATRPSSVPPARTLPSAAQLLESMRSRRDQLRGLRTLARVRYRSPRGNESARNVLAVERPDRLRIEVVSILGSMLIMTSASGTFSAYVPRESTVYRGTASIENLSPYLPVDISVPGIIDHVLATPALSADGRVAVDWDAGLIRVSHSGSDGGWHAYFRDIQTPAAYREVDRDGHTTIEAVYDDIDDSGAMPIARRITVRFPATQESLEISMKDPEINPALSSRLFSITPPANTREIDLDHAAL